jgi:hypothetical protein
MRDLRLLAEWTAVDWEWIELPDGRRLRRSELLNLHDGSRTQALIAAASA